MVQRQSFTVKQNGNVRAGSFSYFVDPQVGLISYQGWVTVGLWPYLITKRYDAPAATYQADPKDLLSTAFQKPGDKILIGPVTFTAISVQPGKTIVQIIVSGQNIKGSAVLNTTGANFLISSVLANVGIGPFNLALEITEVPASIFFKDFPWWYAKPFMWLNATFEKLFGVD